MTLNTRQEQNSEKRRFWQVHIQAWERSGFSQNEYCRRHQLNSSQLRYWKRKLAAESNCPIEFVPVSISSSRELSKTDSGDSGLSIILDNDIQIRLNNDFSPSSLVKVVAILGGTHS